MKHSIGIQAYHIVKKGSKVDEEFGNQTVHDFTVNWVDFNCQNLSNVNWRQGCVRPIYGLSRYYADFTLHSPTDSEMDLYWTTHFPRFTRPFAKITLLLRKTCGYLICACNVRFLQRWKLWWCIPAELDLNHGFKLIYKN